MRMRWECMDMKMQGLQGGCYRAEYLVSCGRTLPLEQELAGPLQRQLGPCLGLRPFLCLGNYFDSLRKMAGFLRKKKIWTSNRRVWYSFLLKRSTVYWLHDWNNHQKKLLHTWRFWRLRRVLHDHSRRHWCDTVTNPNIHTEGRTIPEETMTLQRFLHSMIKKEDRALIKHCVENQLQQLWNLYCTIYKLLYVQRMNLYHWICSEYSLF